MNDKNEFENNIISEIKELIISDNSLSYGERNSLEKFIIRTNQGQDFVEAVGSLLRNLNRLENKELQKQGLSLNVKKIFITLRQKYGIPEEKKLYSLWWDNSY